MGNEGFFRIPVTKSGHRQPAFPGLEALVVADLPGEVQFCPCGQGFPLKVPAAPSTHGDPPHRAVQVPVDRNRAWHPQRPGEGAHHPRAAVS